MSTYIRHPQGFKARLRMLAERRVLHLPRLAEELKRELTPVQWEHLLGPGWNAEFTALTVSQRNGLRVLIVANANALDVLRDFFNAK